MVEIWETKDGKTLLVSDEHIHIYTANDNEKTKWAIVLTDEMKNVVLNMIPFDDVDL